MKQIIFSVPEDMDKQLRARAKDEGRTLSEMVRRIITVSK